MNNTICVIIDHIGRDLVACYNIERIGYAGIFTSKWCKWRGQQRRRTNSVFVCTKDSSRQRFCRPYVRRQPPSIASPPSKFHYLHCLRSFFYRGANNYTIPSPRITEDKKEGERKKKKKRTQLAFLPLCFFHFQHPLNKKGKKVGRKERSE